MITPEEIVDMTDLTPAEVAEHEHVSEICAAALADWVMHQHDGARPSAG